MKNRRYIVDDTPKLVSWLELIDYNIKEDVEPLTEYEIFKLTKLVRYATIHIGGSEIIRVI